MLNTRYSSLATAGLVSVCNAQDNDIHMPPPFSIAWMLNFTANTGTKGFPLGVNI